MIFNKRTVRIMVAVAFILAIAFVFVFDLAGDVAGDPTPALLSGNDRALAVDIALGDWREDAATAGPFDWNEPLRLRRLREQVPEAFPADRNSQVLADYSGTSLQKSFRSNTLYLHFQYRSADLDEGRARAVFGRLAAAYCAELGRDNIKARPGDEMIARDADMRLQYLMLILIKCALAAIVFMFTASILVAFARDALKLRRVFLLGAIMFGGGVTGLLLTQAEFFLSPQFASYPEESVLLGQKISVSVSPSTNKPSAIDWRAVPESAAYRLAMLKRDYPDMKEAEARRMLSQYPFDTALLRGESFGEDAGWYFTVRVAKRHLPRETEVRTNWLGELFLHMKNGFEGFLAADGYAVSAKDTVKTVSPWPNGRGDTRLRAAVFLLLLGIGGIWWLRRDP